jgi:hypothetical protein
MPKTQGADAQDAPFTIPDLAEQTAEQLAGLLKDANAELDSLLTKRDSSKLDRLNAVADARKQILARQAELAAEQAEIDAQFDAVAAELAAGQPGDPEGGEGDGDAAPDTAPEGGDVVEGQVVTAPAPQAVAASGRPQGGAVARSRELGGLSGPRHNLNPSLAGIRAAGPAVQAPGKELALTASINAPGVGMGDRLRDLRQLSEVVENRARGMSDASGFRSTRANDLAFRERAVRGEYSLYDGGRVHRSSDPYGGTQVATLRNEFDTVLHDGSSPDVVAAYIEKLRSGGGASNFEALVAAGGWCAPSQIRYDFFNIAAQSGMIDLPTFGVERGGINFPVSPSLADTFSPALPWYTAFSNATVPWLWTEGDDILAVTGSPTKPCIRVPCSTMTDRRLECYGICLTAGNLADNAWPESTANFIRLLMAAHYHAANARYIATIASLAVANAGCGVTGLGTAAPILDTAELGAIDYRAKYGMAMTDVMEWVYPEWGLGSIRADLAKRTGVDPHAGFRVTDQDIADWFSVRHVRAQFVQDYQVRAAGQPGASTSGGITSYPSTIKGLMYAAGTVARGNGMALDLGVVRDSTLNRTNDFTAMWMEECHLIARFGHEIREYTINNCPSGTTGAANQTSCCP